MIGRLIDEHSTPGLREVIGTMLSAARSADFAIGHVRLCAIDLVASELSGVQKCRLLLDRLDVAMLTDAADIASARGDMAENLQRLLAFALCGRLELRSAVTPMWTPDFSIYSGLPVSQEAPAGCVCLVGAHYFSRPVMLDGASFTCLLTEPAAIANARARFNQLWENGHDVLPVVRNMLADILDSGDQRLDAGA